MTDIPFETDWFETYVTCPEEDTDLLVEAYIRADILNYECPLCQDWHQQEVEQGDPDADDYYYTDDDIFDYLNTSGECE